MAESPFMPSVDRLSVQGGEQRRPIIDPESVTFGRHAREGGEGEGGRRIRFGKKSKLAIAVVEFI